METENLGLPPSGAMEDSMVLLPCHLSRGEIEGFNALQGGESIDPFTGEREYSKLGKIIEIPEIRDLIIEVADDMMKDFPKVPKDIKKISKESELITPPFQEVPIDKDPAIDRLNKEGREGDRYIGLLPTNLIMLLGSLRGDLSVNPATDMFEFFFGDDDDDDDDDGGGFFGTIFRTVATIGGALMGGPMGAGIGNALGNLATGRSVGDSVKSGLMSYGMAGLGNMAFGGAPMAGAFGSTWGAGAGGTAAGMGATGANAVAPAVAGATGAGTAAGQAAGMGFGNLGSILSNNALPIAGYGLLGLMGHSAQNQKHKQSLEKKRKFDEGLQRDINASGMNTPLARPKTSRRANPYYIPETQRVPGGYYNEPPFIEDEYKKGGRVIAKAGKLIKGPGDGQADKIKTNLKEGDYVIDASSVADFGNGSSEAGGEVLKKFQDFILKDAPKTNSSKAKRIPSQDVPVYLSKQEFPIDKRVVAVLGNGDNEHGAKLLKRMVTNLRRHKNSNGLGLPPKARTPFEYMGV